MAGACSTDGRDEEMRGACKILIGKLDGKILLWGPGHEWEGNTKMDRDWIHVTQDRAQSHLLVNPVMNVWVLKSMGNFD
jgi:hypothetical protein